jgi:hypothetical protein
LQKSFVVKSPINFVDFGFFVRVGDILVHDTANNNRLTVYRNGEIAKVITQTPLGMAALTKSDFIAEVLPPPPGGVLIKVAAAPAPTKQQEPKKKAKTAPLPALEPKALEPAPQDDIKVGPVPDNFVAKPERHRLIPDETV